MDYFIFTIPIGVIGARAMYVLARLEEYDSFSEMVSIWNGGLAIYGGIIGGILCAYIVCKVEKMNFWNLLDMVGISLLIGQGIGRWGNFTNQEAFGTNTTLPWGMTSDKIATYINSNQAEFAKNGFEMDPNLPVHPTFLYESLWCESGQV